MRKEPVIAIIAGLFLGGIITFGIWRTNTAFERSPEKESTSASKPRDTKTYKDEPQTNGLILSQPEDLEVVVEPTVRISGLTKANSYVVISSEEEDYIIRTDEKGGFEENVKLKGGLNQIVLKAIDTEGNTTDKTIRVVYSSEFDKYLKKSEENQ